MIRLMLFLMHQIPINSFILHFQYQDAGMRYLEMQRFDWQNEPFVLNSPRQPSQTQLESSI